MHNLLREKVLSELQQKYEEIPEKIYTRVCHELSLAKENGRESEILATMELCNHLNKHDYLYWLSGSTASSILFYLTGAASCNPLPAHRYCKKCKKIVFHENEAESGFDLMPTPCKCAGELVGDGHNIPAETFWQTSEDNRQNTVQTINICVHESIFPILVKKLIKALPQHEKNAYLCESGNYYIGKISLLHSDYLSNKALNRDYSNEDLRLFAKKMFYENYFSQKNNPSDAIEDINRGYSEKFHNTSLSMFESFNEILRGIGIAHATLKKETANEIMLNNLPIFRDEMCNELTKLGFSNFDASQGMSNFKNGKSQIDIIKQKLSKEMCKHCDNVIYAFPKSHEIEFIIANIKTRQSNLSRLS